MRKRPTGVDLYSGVGGMSLGFEQAGFELIAAADAEKIHVDTYLENFPSCGACCVDLSTVSGALLREMTGIGDQKIDVLFGGPPCQGFSLIGKRLMGDPRNLLLHEFARLVIELSPTYFVMENVDGILRGDTRRILDEFIAHVQEAGYSVVKPIQVLDAAEFGVPQRRRRLFVLGHADGVAAPRYPTPRYWFDLDGGIDCPTVWDAISDLAHIGKSASLLESDGYHGDLGKPSVYSETLRGETSDGDDKSPKRRRNGNGLSGCLRTEHTLTTVKRFGQTEQGESEKISRYPRLAKHGLAPTLRAGTGPEKGSFMAARPIHPTQPRCITVREAARLHSFPDWFHFHSTKWHGFRQIGNSVPPLLGRAVAKAVLQALAEDSQS